LEGSRAIAQHELPDTVRATSFTGGALANSHFLAIPANASNPEGAMVVANFLLSAEAQVRKADVAVWGDPTVLDISALSPSDRRLFDEQSADSPGGTGGVLSEPHPSWSAELERHWIARYGVR
jgi:putative thiamine transport system substrate-binding protein